MDETQNAGDTSNGYGPVTATMVEHLGQTRPWVLLVGALGFVATGLLVLVSGIMMVVGVFSPVAEIDGAASGMIAVLYLLMAVIYFFVSLYLVRYARSIKSLVATHQPIHMEQALDHQRAFWRIVGIISAIYIVLAVMGVLFAVVAGLLAS